MKENVRFYALVAAVGIGLVGAFLLLRTFDAGVATKTVERADTLPPSKLHAPEIVSSRRESRFTPTASRPVVALGAPRAAKAGAYAVSGLVKLMGEELPVDGADVSVYPVEEDEYFAELDKGAGWRTRTNEKGLFRVTALPAGRFILIASKQNLAGVDSVTVNPRELEDTTTTIEMQPIGFIAGHVRNEAGEALPDAFVVLGQGKRGDQDVYGYSQGTTRADGSFRLEYVPEGEWLVRAQADGYAYADAEHVAQNSDDAVIVLKRGGSVSGRVIDANSEKPVPNVALRLGAENYMTQFSPQKATTDANGEFAINDLGDGEHSIWLYKQPYVMVKPRETFKIENANHVDDLELRVMLGGAISGRATDAVTGAPIPGMEFSTRGPTSVTAETDEDGMYRLDGLHVGSYVVRRRWMAGYRHGEDRENKSAMVQLGEETSGIDFAVPPGLYLRGRVVDEDGAPLAMVRLSSQTPENGEGDSSESDDKGRWVHRGFSAGSVVTVTAEKPGYYAKPIENITIPDHDLNDVEIVMETGGTIAGEVVDQTGKPVKDTAVSAKPVDRAGAEQRNGYTRGDGAFTVNGLAEGTYKLSARPPRSWGDTDDAGTKVRVAKGERVTGVRLVLNLDAGAKLAGRVLDSASNPIRDASVGAHMTDGNSGGNVQSDADGRFEIAGLNPGTFRVNVDHPDYSRLQTDIVAPDTNLTLTLRGKGTIQGRVVDARSGQPLNAFSIVADPGENMALDPSATSNSGQPFADVNGQFELKVDEGATTLKVRAKDYAPKAHVVPNVRADQITSGMEIRLVPGGVVEGTVTNQQGGPLMGADIWLNQVPQQAWEHRQRPAMALTGEDGRFRIDSLPLENTTIIATHPDYLPEQAVVLPSPGRGTPVNLVLGAGGGLEGMVRIAGKPAVGYQVGVQLPQSGPGFSANAPVGENGQYTFQYLPAGEAQVQVSGTLRNAPNRSTQRSTTIFDGQVTMLDIDLGGGTADIEGTVTREGKPVANASVEFSTQRADIPFESVNVQTDAKGAYKIADVPSGPANVTINVQGPHQWKNHEVQLEDNRTIRLDVAFAAAVPISGTVAGVSDNISVGITLFRGEVAITDTDSSFSVSGDQAFQTHITGNGTFKIDGVEVGEYTLVAVATEPNTDGAPAKRAIEAITVTKNNPLKLNLTLH